jgi:hypothetical protein
MRRLALACLLATAAAAQSPPPPAPPPDGPKQRVSGRVLSAQTNQPIRGAQVVLINGRDELVSTYTTPDGRFVLEESPVGNWRVSALKSGYADLMERVAVPAAQPLTGLELRINRYAVITGRVVDSDNRPVVGARVMALTPSSEDGETVWRNASGRGPGGGQTDDRGEYRVWGLSPGPYVVGAYPNAEVSSAGILRFESSGAFYPNVRTLADADRISVDWGQVRERLDLRLDPPGETRVAIQAVLPKEAPAPCDTCGVGVLLDDPETVVRIGDAMLSPENVALIEGLPAGDYIIQLRGFDRSRGSMWQGMAKLALSGLHAEPLVVAASGEVPVNGKIVLEGRPEEEQGKPFRGGLRIMPPRNLMELGLFTRSMFANIEITGTEAPFTLSAFPGVTGLRLDSAEGYVSGVTLDGKPLESPTLTIPEAGIPDGIVIRVRFDAGFVEGTIDAPRAAAGTPKFEYAVYARPAQANPFLPARYLPVQPTGAFRQKLPPGVYELVAFPTGRGTSPLADPAQAEALAKGSKRVEIKVDETTNVTLPVVGEP